MSLKMMAEDTGFEPAEALTSTVFKTAALNHSANPPTKCIIQYLNLKSKRKTQKDK